MLPSVAASETPKATRPVWSSMYPMTTRYLVASAREARRRAALALWPLAQLQVPGLLRASWTLDTVSERCPTRASTLF
jgi:hypothetical protein